MSLNSEIRAAKEVIGKHTEDIASLERLDSSRVAKLETCYESHDDLEKSSKVKNRLLWILGAVAVVEGVVIGVAVGTK